MKKNIIPFFMLISILFISCKQAGFDQMPAPQGQSTVIIGIAEDEVTRAVDSATGLPVLNSAEMTIKVTKADGTDIKKTVATTEPKTMSLTLPVGEKIKVSVRVYNDAAQWYGEKEHTVTEGANAISVKLKKSAEALNSLLFGTGKPHASQYPYTLTLNIGSKEIKKENIRYHNFCRDNKGRTYLAYQEGNDYKLERYTSEGDKEDKTFTLPEHCHRLMLASDHKTGKVYLVSEIRAVMTLFRINENGGSPTELTGDPIRDPTGYAVYNNVVVASGYASGVQGQVLKMYGINGDNLSEIPLPVQPNLSEDTKIMLGSFSDPHVRINDLYMTENTLYVLFSGYNHSGQPYSLGGIVKYSYTAESTSGTISNPKRIGIKSDHTADAHGIYATDEDNFYGPVKVVGFDAENLYIADDGVKFSFQNGRVRIAANKNRLATLKKADDTLEFRDTVPAGIFWQNESPKWTGSKTLVWKKGQYGIFSYYQLNSANDPLPSEAFKPGYGTEGINNYLTDVFCYDEEGNLYIVKRYNTTNYQVCRFALKDDGSYNTYPDIAGGSTPTNLSDSPDAIAVGKSGNTEYLYYSYNSGSHALVKRLKWSNSFDGAENDAGFNFPPQHSKTITALAANEDGLFAALKEYHGIGYTVTVQKYAHNDGSAVGATIHVLDEVINGGTWSRPGDVTALHIHEGFLYGLTAVQYRYDWNTASNVYCKDSISGKLLKIGNSTANFIGRSQVLHTTELPRGQIHDSTPEANAKRKEGGKFAPYRFIAVKPKKLVIASDGFWGYITDVADPTSDQTEQFNFIWDFSIKTDGSLEGMPASKPADSAIEFSKKLTRSSGCDFDWK